MTNTYSQDDRTGRLATPLGKDQLLLVRFEGHEALGELFELRVEALSPHPTIDFKALLGQDLSIHLDTVDGVGRDFAGILTDARWLGPRGRLWAYSLVLRPWFWLLSLTSDCRIFKDMTPPDIIRQVFRDRGFTNRVVDLVARDYPTLDYCVQYRETDLNFVLRLMEEYGIYFFFAFGAGDGVAPSPHHLVMADVEAHLPLPGLRTVVYSPPASKERHDMQRLRSWTRGQAMVTGVFTLNDYYYEKPSADLLATASHPYPFAHGDMEIYNYPGDYDEKGRGRTLATVLRDAERTRNDSYAGAGYAPTLTPGYTVTRASQDGNGSGADDGSYLILRCSHYFGAQTYETTGTSQGADGGTLAYFGDYELARDEVPYRMPARARRPVIAGTQSALVVGKQGEEIDVDEEGRICVQFYWDRKKTASRRVRVAQFWAGKHRGALFLPRIGDEVLVQYEEGDPDRPLVVGSVYNGTNQMEAKMPDQKNTSGILTMSTKNKPSGYNFLVFDDTAGQERVKLRAERDLLVKALHNEIRVIGASQTESVGGDLTQSVAGDQSLTVGTLSPPGGGNYTLSATQSIVLQVGSTSSITITPESITIQAPMIYLNP